MRTKDVINEDFNEVRIFLTYLYMNEDNYVIVNNGLTDLKITMDEDCEIYMENLTFKNSPPMVVNSGVPFFLGCIEQLKRQPSDYCDSKWEEIKAQVAFALI